MMGGNHCRLRDAEDGNRPRQTADSALHAQLLDLFGCLVGFARPITILRVLKEEAV